MVAGTFKGFMELAGTSLSGGDGDGFLVKYDTNGTLIWARRMGGIHADRANGVAIDPDGNILSLTHFKK